MRLSEIPDKTNLELHLSLKDKHYTINVNTQFKASEYVFIQPISNNGIPIDKLVPYNPTLIYKTMDGIFLFKNLNIKVVYYKGTCLYAISSSFEAERENRRDAFRVFLSDATSLKITKRDGKVIELFGLLKDLSLTGMGIILKYKTEDILSMEITIDCERNTKMTLSGEVVRITELPNQKGYLYGCRFYQTKETLNRYLLKMQVQNKVRN